ncbi:MAG: phosphoadenylyl-sulfate reductase [Bacteroidia bacterium]|nr:phosphoadenylyl-sulfate reductase [Bacteroidia bacterium]HQU99745.1 phosphoadenylyl-sulfate reductase [Bacteroidia bacterium]
MTVSEIGRQIENYKKRGLSLFTTCSFQSHSIVLLHILTTIDKNITVYFINTGFHFTETIAYKNQIAALLKINVKSLSSHVPKSLQKDMNNQFLFASDADHCCYINKTMPVNGLLHMYDVWINGVRADQSSTRKNFKTEEPTPHHAIRFHPMLDWTPKMIYDYAKTHNLPKHPLEEKGFFSIGCEPCTHKFEISSRGGRWYGLKKTECGLNTDLIADKK